MESSKGLRELTDIYLKEISADTALRASKEADKARGKAAAGGDKEKAKAKAAQASRLYKASAEKRKSEPAATPDRSYPKGKGASYQEDKDWGYDEDGNSLNPVDIEKREREDDDLAGAPNKKGKKKAKKDFDGDGKLESPEGEYKGSKDKAIKKAMKKESNEIVTALRGLVEKNNESYSESVGTAIDKTLGAAGEIADTAIKLPAKAVGYAKGLKKGLKKASKEGENKAASSSSPKEEMELLNKLVESGQFTQEEIDAIVEADRLGKIEEARRADKMGIARKKVTYDKGSETRNPNPDRGATSSHKPEGSSLSGSKAASRSRSLGDKRRAANRKGANLAYGDREGRLANFAATKRQSDADLGAQKAATDTGAHKDKKTGYRQDHKYGERGDKRRPSYNPKHTANK